MNNSSNPKISVVMAVFNGMPYLSEAVDSILTQTYKNFEFIIVDDASADKSWKFLKSIKDKRLVLLQNKNNMGLANSLNKALEHAKGDFIARMDADDISVSTRLFDQLSFMLKHPEIDIVGSWADKIDEKGEITGEIKYPTEDTKIKRRLAWHSPIIHPTFFAQSKIFKQLKYYNPEFDFAEEYDFLLRAKSKYKMANVPKKLLKYRIWNNRRSKTSWHKMEKVDFEVKKQAYKRGEFDKSFLIILAAKYIITYILPFNLKLRMFKLFKVI